MKNSYFETIDERLFQECSLLRHTLEKEYRKALEMAKEQESLEMAFQASAPLKAPQTPSKSVAFGFFTDSSPEAKLTFGHRSSSTERAPAKKRSLFSLFKRKTTNDQDAGKRAAKSSNSKGALKRTRSDFNGNSLRPGGEANAPNSANTVDELTLAGPGNFQQAQLEYQNKRYQVRLARDPGFQSRVRKAHELQKISEQLSRLGGPVDYSSALSGIR
jgi:hypothetical protein